jgi:hypothetical protein
MKVRQSFTIDSAAKQSEVYFVAKELGVKLKQHKLSEKLYRVWLIATETDPVPVPGVQSPARPEPVTVAPEENPEESKTTAEESFGIHQATPKVDAPPEESKPPLECYPECQRLARQVENSPDSVPITPRKKIGRPRRTPMKPVIVAPVERPEPDIDSGEEDDVRSDGEDDEGSRRVSPGR